MRKVVLNKQALTGYTIYQTCPIGTVLGFAGTTIPTGFLPCDGRALSRTEYSELFKVIGTIYGAGDGKTTFNLPNTIKKVIEGADASTLGKKYNAGLPNITGTFKVYTDSYISQCTGAFDAYNSENNGESYSFTGRSPIYTFDASRSNAIYGKSETVQMDAVGMYQIIKVKSYALDNPESGGGGEKGTKVIANPTVRGTEPQLTSLQVGEQKYIVGSGVLDNLQDMILTMCGALGELRYFPDKEYHRGFLCCDGRTFLPKVYPEFFAFWKIHFEEKCGYDHFGYPKMPDYSGRYIRGTEAGENPFDLEEDSLPNVTGSFYGGLGNYTNYGFGAHEQDFSNTTTTDKVGIDGNTTVCMFKFNASKGNPIYGRNKKKPDKVVVNNVNSHIFIKAI